MIAVSGARQQQASVTETPVWTTHTVHALNSLHSLISTCTASSSNLAFISRALKETVPSFCCSKNASICLWVPVLEDLGQQREELRLLGLHVRVSNLSFFSTNLS